MAGFAAARMALNLNDGAHRLCSVCSPFACPVLGLCMKAAHNSLVSMC